MTPPDKLNVAGIMVSGFGSTLAMFGVYMQMNGYFAFKPAQLFRELWHIVRSFLREGYAAGLRRVSLAAALARDREERDRSLVGFYCVLFGFFFQMFGSLLMLWAVLHGPAQTPGKG